MAENLNYNASGSKCGDNDILSNANTSSCDTYGRLYNWETAKTVCPSGWHLPSDEEWTTLTNFVGTNAAGTKLKAINGWNGGGNGTNDYGFSALPGGNGNSYGSFVNAGNYGYWWSATEYNASRAYYWRMDYDDAYVYGSYGGVISNINDKSSLYSVRCVRN